MTTRTKPVLISSARPDSSAAASNHHPVLELPARAIASLPEPITLWLSVPGSPTQVCFSTAPAAVELTKTPVALADTIVFDGSELDALVCAAEADRLWHADFLGLCFEKWRRSDFRIQSEDTLAGANPDPAAVWTLERVLQRLGARLECVAFDVDTIAPALHAAA